MPTGRILEIWRDPVTGKDYGRIQDKRIGKEVKFEAPGKMFQINQLVSYEKEPPTERKVGALKGVIDVVKIKGI